MSNQINQAGVSDNPVEPMEILETLLTNPEYRKKIFNAQTDALMEEAVIRLSFILFSNETLRRMEMALTELLEEARMRLPTQFQDIISAPIIPVDRMNIKDDRDIAIEKITAVIQKLDKQITELTEIKESILERQHAAVVDYNISESEKINESAERSIKAPIYRMPLNEPQEKVDVGAVLKEKAPITKIVSILTQMGAGEIEEIFHGKGLSDSVMDSAPANTKRPVKDKAETLLNHVQDVSDVQSEFSLFIDSAFGKRQEADKRPDVDTTGLTGAALLHAIKANQHNMEIVMEPFTHRSTNNDALKEIFITTNELNEVGAELNKTQAKKDDCLQLIEEIHNEQRSRPGM